jgi:benzoyl-CoA reductase subunit C
MIETFTEIYNTRHDYARRWKDEHGGKVLGTFCTYVPDEILYAANVLPVRILGSHEPQNVTEPHIFAMYCPFCRDCLAQGLLGRYDYLDGIMIAQSCLHIRQAFTSWDKHVNDGFSYYLPMPHNVQNPERAIPFLRGELETFKNAVEDWTGATITDADLDRGIEIVNANRRAMKTVYESRKGNAPPINGVEAMHMVVTSQFTDKAEHTKIIEQCVAAMNGRTPANGNGMRLMLLGSENDDTAFIDMVESAGSTVVIDDHCTGTRAFWEEVEPEDDRLLAIAKRYVNRTPCPTKDWPQRKRLDRIIEFAKEWDVSGAVIVQQKFCDPHELDIPSIREALEGIGVKTLFLELDVTVPIGQFKVRVEAFLEMLSEEDLF